MAAQTLHDAEATWFFAPSKGKPPSAGLFGGKLVPGDQGFRLVRYSLAPGVAVSGKLSLVRGHLPIRFAGSVTVTGPAAAAGKLRVSGTRIQGVLGGRRVSGGV